MDRERAEAYLRLLAEEELRRPGWPRRVRLWLLMGVRQRMSSSA